MVPCIVLDTETTGFPNKGAGFCARIIEVGAVVITAPGTPRRVVSPISFLVRQPRDHLETWQACKAMEIHGISANEVLRNGLDPSEAAPRFARWVRKVRERYGVSEVRAFNQGFDFWFLEREPWDLFGRTGLVPGRDIQAVAAAAMQHKRPGLARAVRYCQGQGASLDWSSRAHRALEDARIAAEVALYLEHPPSEAHGDAMVA